MDSGVWKSFSGPDLCSRCVSDIIAHPQHILFFRSGRSPTCRFFVPISNRSAAHADRWSACDTAHKNVRQSLPVTMRCAARAISASINFVIQLFHFSKNRRGGLSTSFYQFFFSTIFHLKFRTHLSPRPCSRTQNPRPPNPSTQKYCGDM